MDNLESLIEEEKRLIKNKKITHATFVILWIMAFLIQMFVLVDPIVPLIFFAVAFVVSIMWWIASNKVKKIEKEIAEIKKE